MPFATILDVVAERAGGEGDKTAFIFEPGPVSCGELWRAANRFASFLLSEGVERGEPVLLALPNGREFFAAFFGVQRAGGVAVPIFPSSGPERIADLARHCGARRLVVPRSAEAPALPLDVVRVGDGEGSPAAVFPEPSPGDLAFLQYTSGSTGNPKGVELRHENVLANLRQLIAGFALTERDVFVSWLPVFHDMGLVLMALVPLVLGARAVILPTSLASVRPWLRAVESHRATFTAAPDFAYRLLRSQVREPRRYDLSSLRVALNAAEAVRAGTVAAFESAFGLGNVMIAGYGLAEATVGVSSWPPGTPSKVDPRGFVSIGKPFPGVEMGVLAGDELAGAPTEGEIVVRSPAATRGYFRNPEATAELQWRDGWIRTGDLGYCDGDGDFFIVGRKKNVILHAGRNLAPQEIEEVADQVPAVRRSAALGVDRGRLEGEQVYVFAEIRRRTPERDWPDLVRTLVERIHGRLGLRPARVYLLRPRSIPLTANGKLRHAELRERYLGGSLRREGSLLFPDY